MNAVIVVPAGVGMEQLTSCVASSEGAIPHENSRVRARWRSCQAGVAVAANSSAGRCQPRVLRGRLLTSAAIRPTSWAVWALRSVPFGK